MNTEAITVGFLGVDERSQSAYQIFFESISWAECILVDDLTQAQLCLIDVDAYNTQQQYKEFVQNYPDKTVLKISIDNSLSDREDVQLNNRKEFFLKKPVKRENFQDLLRKIFQHSQFKEEIVNEQGTALESKTNRKLPTQENITKVCEQKSTIEQKSDTEIDAAAVNTKSRSKEKKKIPTANAGKLINVKNEEHLVGYQNDIDVNNAGQLKNIFYDPDTLIQTIIERVCIKSKQKEKIIRLTVLNTVLYFDAQVQKVYSTSEAGIIQSLCLVPHNNSVSYCVKKLPFRNKLNEVFGADNKTLEQQSWDMEAFVWLVALWSSRGRVAKGTDLNKRVALMQWPNLTRLAPVPHAVRIAALLYEKPYTLTEAAKLLAIEQRYVFAFYSACKAIGLIRISRRREERDEDHKHYNDQSLLKKILGKLLKLSK